MAEQPARDKDRVVRLLSKLGQRISNLSASQSVLVLFAIISAIALWAASPLYQWNTSSALTRLQSHFAYSEIQQNLNLAIENGRTSYDDRGSLSITPLVRLDYRISTAAGETVNTPIEGEEDGSFTTRTKVISDEYASLAFDFEAATIFFGFAMILLVSAYVLVSQNDSMENRDEPRQSKINDDEIPANFLADSAKFARIRADGIYRRATYLLISGVIMAFVGIGVFYFSLTQDLSVNSRYFNLSAQVWEVGDLIEQIDESVSSAEALTELNARLDQLELAFSEDEKTNIQVARYLHLLRAFGMLFFIEAVAWFLLRQYRQLVDDQKWAFSQYLKRSNFLAASEMTENDKDGKMALLASILQEDHSGRLSPGQTTEQLEGAKTNASNPIFDLVGKLIDRNSGDSER